MFELQIVKMMIVVVTIFGACWLPMHVYWVICNQNPDVLNYRSTQPTYLALYWLAMSNAMYNPLIYCWMNARLVTARSAAHSSSQAQHR